MRKIEKDHNFKTVIVTVSILLLFTDLLYSFSSPKETLRIPFDKKYTRPQAYVDDSFLTEKKKDNSSNQFEVRLPFYIDQFDAFIFEGSLKHLDEHFKDAIEDKESKVVICDIMCATGKVGLYLQEAFGPKIESLIFADGSNLMLKEISPNNLRTLTLSESLAFKPSSFDIVASRYGMNNIEEKLYPDIIKEYLRILKDRGTLIIQDHFPTNEAEKDAINSLEQYISTKDGRKDKPYIPTVAEFEKLLERIDGKVIKRTEFMYEFSLKDRFTAKGIEHFDVNEAIHILEAKQGVRYEISGDDVIIRYPITTLSIEIMSKDKESVFIKLLDPSEYYKYSAILMQIVREELQVKDKTKNSSTSEFYFIMEKLASAYIGGEDNILTFFMATNAKGEVIGAIEIDKTYVKELESEVPTMVTVVRKKYQGKGIGTALKETALKWMIGEGYDKAVTYISTDNRPSLKSFKKACDNLGLTLESIEEFTTATKEMAYCYVVTLTVSLKDLVRTSELIATNKTQICL